MRFGWFFSLLKWIGTLGLMAGLLFIGYLVHGEMEAERAQEASGERVQSPRRTKHGVIDFGVENGARYGLATQPAQAVTWSEQVLVYGQVVPNPRATVEVRAPFGGSLRAAAESGWPSPGQWVRAGQSLGWLDIRIAPQERLTLRDNLSTARLKKQGAEQVVALQQDRVDRLERVTRSELVSRQQLDDARVLLTESKTQLAIAAAAVDLWRKALDEVDRPGERQTSTTYTQPLLAPGDGEVTELTAKPGMAVEPGALVLQLVDFRQPLVLVEIPPALLSAGAPRQVLLIAASANRSAVSEMSGQRVDPAPPAVEATLVGPAPRVDAASQFVGYWYKFDEASPVSVSAARPTNEGDHP